MLKKTKSKNCWFFYFCSLIKRTYIFTVSFLLFSFLLDYFLFFVPNTYNYYNLLNGNHKSFHYCFFFLFFHNFSFHSIIQNCTITHLQTGNNQILVNQPKKKKLKIHLLTSFCVFFVLFFFLF